MGKKCCCRNRFYDWSYNNPRIDRKLTDLHKRLSELDDILCARKKSEKTVSYTHLTLPTTSRV